MICFVVCFNDKLALQIWIRRCVFLTEDKKLTTSIEFCPVVIYPGTLRLVARKGLLPVPWSVVLAPVIHYCFM